MSDRYWKSHRSVRGDARAGNRVRHQALFLFGAVVMSLKQRFERFMLSTPGVESVDELLRHRAPVDLQRADYLACDRRAVIEVKSLDVNPDYKIQRFLDGLAQAGRLPSAGDTTLAELLSKLPDGPALL